ncbi:MAG: hypothetical protein ACR2GX_01865 [Candidatus Dormibacteria bacterium]
MTNRYTRASTVQDALIAGFVGTTVEALVARLTSGGSPGVVPVVAPSQMAKALTRRYFDKSLTDGQASVVGMAMRWTYGPSWGVVATLIMDLKPRMSVMRGGAILGATIWAFELAALPATGATPPLSKWGARAILGDGAQACAFGFTVAACHRVRN